MCSIGDKNFSVLASSLFWYVVVEKRSEELELGGVGLELRVNWQHAHSKLPKQVFEAYVENSLIASDDDSSLDLDLT